MITILRRLFWLGLLGGAGYAGWTLWQRQTAAPPAAAPEWPPMPAPQPAPADPPAAEPQGFAAIADELPDAATPDDTAEIVGAVPTAPTAGRRWVAPLPDGTCPDGYPIKGNDNSGIYHVPGGRFYERTVAERCYATAADAEADGYRAAKA